MRFRFRRQEFEATDAAELMFGLLGCLKPGSRPDLTSVGGTLAVWVPMRRHRNGGEWYAVDHPGIRTCRMNAHVMRSPEDLDEECPRWFGRAASLVRVYGDVPEQEPPTDVDGSVPVDPSIPF